MSQLSDCKRQITPQRALGRKFLDFLDEVTSIGGGAQPKVAVNAVFWPTPSPRKRRKERICQSKVRV